MSMTTVKRKAKVVMLPTRKAENSLLMYNNKSLILQFKSNGFYTQEYLKSIHADSHHLYITSDEEIKEDWVYNQHCTNYPKIFKVKSEWLNNEGIYKGEIYLQKIIATTDKSLKIRLLNSSGLSEGEYETTLSQPSKQFIDAYIQSYNIKQPIEHVLVDYEEIEYGHVDDYSKPHGFETRLKVDKANYITITKIKNSWNKEEVKKLINLYATTFVDGNIDQWIDDNSIFLL